MGGGDVIKKSDGNVVDLGQYGAAKKDVYAYNIGARQQQGFDSYLINSLSVQEEEQSTTDFWGNLLDSYGIKDPSLREKVLADQELSAMFVKLATLEINFSDDSKTISSLKEKIREKVLAYVVGDFVGDKKPSVNKFDRVYSSYFYVKRISELRNKIFATGNQEAIELWDTGVSQLNQKYKAGKIKDFNVYLDELEVIFANSIRVTGDKELVKIWEKYEESDSRKEIDTSFVSSYTGQLGSELEVDFTAEKKNHKDEKPAPATKVEETVSEVNGVSGFSAERGSDGGVVVNVDGYFSVNVSVYVNSANEYVYYLNDDYINGGEMRVKPEELLLRLYERHIDGRISKKLSEDPVFVSQISDLPDDDIVRLGKIFLGEKKGNDFKMTGDDLELLDKLVAFLKKDDGRYPTLEKRVGVLNDYLADKSRADFARRELIEGRLLSLDDIINS